MVQSVINAQFIFPHSGIYKYSYLSGECLSRYICQVFWGIARKYGLKSQTLAMWESKGLKRHVSCKLIDSNRIRLVLLWPHPRHEWDFAWRCDLGRCHTNYDIQIIVVILKITTRFFQQWHWIIGKINMIVWGSHMLNMNYKVYCGSVSVELTQ